MSEPLRAYGARLDPRRLGEALAHLFETNRRAQEAGRVATPICIWGTHGLGKTMIVEAFAKARGWGFSYCAPAQIEEMGDLHGLPVLREDADGRARTTFAPPEWVPTAPGPGILLLDDLNRADDRILRGLMQLLQTGGLVSWKLPPGWQIVATANPEGGDYSITPMDDAMLTRFLHVSLIFEPRAWAAWAMAAGVDPRGVDFVLTHPELVNERRTTPRSLTQFFEQIRDIQDIGAAEALVHTLGASALEDTTVAAFLSFSRDRGAALPSTAELLDAEDFAPMAERVRLIAGSGDGRRVDRLGALCTRLALALTDRAYRPGPRHAANLVAFLLSAELPNDLRLALHRELVQDGGTGVVEMLREPRLARTMLELM